MGQGTLTGLAQLVAEELEVRLVEGHDRISDARPEPRAQPRLGQLLDRRQPRHPRVARVRPQGRRRGARDADPGGGRTPGACRPPNARAANSVITHTPSGRTTTYGKVADAAGEARAAEGRQAQGPEGLEDRRQAADAARHGRQAHRQAGLRHRPQAARHAERRDQGLPGLRRQGEELRRRQGAGHAGRQEGRAGRRHRRRRRRRHLVAGQDRARRAADRLGRGPERQGLERRASPTC